MALRPTTDAADISKSPTVRGARTPIVTTTSTACEDRIEETSAVVGKTCGRSTENRMMTATQVMGKAIGSRLAPDIPLRLGRPPSGFGPRVASGRSVTAIEEFTFLEGRPDG